MVNDLKCKSDLLLERYKIFLHDIISKEKNIDVVSLEKRFGDKIYLSKDFDREGEALFDGYYYTKMRPLFEEGKEVSLRELHNDFVDRYENSGLKMKKNSKILLDSFEFTHTIYKPDEPEIYKPFRGIMAIIKFEYDK